MRAAIAGLVVIPLALAGPQRADAQRPLVEGGVGVGPVRLAQSGAVTATLVSASADLQAVGERASGALTGAAAFGADAGTWVRQGLASVSFYAPPFQPWRWEVALAGGGYDANDRTATKSVRAVAREHREWMRGSAYAGVGAARTRWDLTTRSATLVQLGGRLDLGRSRTGGDIEVVTTRDPPIPGGVARRRDYADATLSWAREGRRVTADASVGARLGTGHVRTLAVADVGIAVAPPLSIVIAGGVLPEDLLRGIPETRFSSVTVRLAIGDAATRMRRAAASGVTERPMLIARPIDAGRARLVVRVRGAQTVELMADFTAWEPMVMSRTGDAWIADVPLTPGTHRVAVRVNGGAWAPPFNLPAVDDDFGGRVGLLVVR